MSFSRRMCIGETAHTGEQQMTDEHPDRQDRPGSHTAAPLPVEQLYQSADLGGLDFETTADLAPLPGLSVQPRAYAAINFGTAINQRGFSRSRHLHVS
jgi:hypothetical protein